MTKTIICFVVLFSATMTAIIANANINKEELIVNRVTEKLTLNSVQQEQFRAFVQEKRQLKQQRHKQVQELKSNSTRKKTGPLSPLFEKDQIAGDDISNLLDAAHAQTLKNRESMFSAFATFYNGLSVEQRAQLKPLAHKMLLKKKRKRSERDS